jgi:hypothetical protein
MASDTYRPPAETFRVVKISAGGCRQLMLSVLSGRQISSKISGRLPKNLWSKGSRGSYVAINSMFGTRVWILR